MQTQLLGRATRDGCPYTVELCIDNGAAPILVSYGIGMGAIEADCTLANLLAPGWTEILQWCDCGWLRDLAREEQGRDRLFTADEIWARRSNRRTRNAVAIAPVNRARVSSGGP